MNEKNEAKASLATLLTGLAKQNPGSLGTAIVAILAIVAWVYSEYYHRGYEIQLLQSQVRTIQSQLAEINNILISMRSYTASTDDARLKPRKKIQINQPESGFVHENIIIIRHLLQELKEKGYVLTAPDQDEAHH